MPSTTFVDNVTVVTAEWLNEINDHVFNQPHIDYASEADGTYSIQIVGGVPTLVAAGGGSVALDDLTDVTDPGADGDYFWRKVGAAFTLEALDLDKALDDLTDVTEPGPDGDYVLRKTGAAYTFEPYTPSIPVGPTFHRSGTLLPKFGHTIHTPQTADVFYEFYGASGYHQNASPAGYTATLSGTGFQMSAPSGLGGFFSVTHLDTLGAHDWDGSLEFGFAATRTGGLPGGDAQMGFLTDSNALDSAYVHMFSGSTNFHFRTGNIGATAITDTDTGIGIAGGLNNEWRIEFDAVSTRCYHRFAPATAWTLVATNPPLNSLSNSNARARYTGMRVVSGPAGTSTAILYATGHYSLQASRRV